MATVTELKRRLIEGAIVCEMEGLYEAFGHISVRIPGTDQILVTPATPPGNTKLSEINTLNLDGKKIRGRGVTVGELPIHTSIYRVRNDVQSIIHVHAPLLIAFSIAGKEIFPMRFHDRKFSPSVPIFGDPGARVYIDSDELGEEMARALGQDVALIIRGHGAVIVGESIEAACLNAIALKNTAEIHFMASVLLLSKSKKKDFQIPLLHQRDRKEDIKAFIHKRSWDFYRAKLKRYLRK